MANWRSRPHILLYLVALAALASALFASPALAHHRVLRVGKFHGVKGQFKSIQAAVDAAHPGDWVLIAPGVYHEQGDRAHPPADAETIDRGKYGGVLITTPRLHLRGMGRNRVIIDGTLPHKGPACSSDPKVQDFGVTGPDGTPLGRNGIVIYKAPGGSVENLTACNFLSGSGNSGNQIWWNGGDRSGLLFAESYRGAYLNATSTFFKDKGTAASYGIFSSTVTGPGVWDHTYASNMSDAAYYIGACRDQCNQVMNHDRGQFSDLGYSGTNAGGTLIVKNSEFDQNQSGFVTNSQNNDDYFSPQDGTCANGATSPITHTTSCWVFMHNFVHDNNNPNVPTTGSASAGPVGSGVVVAGGRFDTVMDNRITNNGAWGVLFVPYPDTGTPPPLAHCQGGSEVPTVGCVYDDWGNVLLHNTFVHNGFFGNDTNSDFGEITTFSGNPINCYKNNNAPDGSSPSNLEQTNGNCGQTGTADPNPALLNQALCDTGIVGTPCPPGSSYPRRTQVIMHPLPHGLKSMRHPCRGVPNNPWC